MRGTLIERALAVVVLCAFLGVSTFGVAPSLAAGPDDSTPGVFSGRITYLATGGAMMDAALQASHLGTKVVYTSAETEDLGRYALENLPAGTYDLAVRTDRGLYAVESLVTLAPGESKTLNLAVSPTAPNRKAADDPPGGTQQGAEAAAKKKSFLSSPVAVTLLFLGTASIIGLALDNNNNNSNESNSASRSLP